MSDVVFPQPHVLSSRNFRLLWLGQAISAFGDKFTEIAIPIFVFNLTGSALQLGLAFIVQTVSAFLFGLLAGTLVDRWDHRQTMIGSDIIRAIILALVTILTVVTIETNVKLILLYSLAFIAAATKQFFLPAKVATIPKTVNNSQLLSANSFDQSTMTFVGFLGFGAAGALIEFAGETTAFIIDSSTFLISAIFIVLIRLQQTPSQKQESRSIWEDTKEGLQYVVTIPILRSTVILSMLAPLAIGATQPLLLIFSRQILKVGDLGFGLLEGAFALGVTFGAFLLSKIKTPISRIRLMALGVAGMGIGQISGVLVPFLLSNYTEVSYILMIASLPFFFLGSASNAAIFIGIRTIVQETSPKDMIGRVFSVITVVSSTAIALGAGLAGIADSIHIVVVLLFWGVFLVVVGLGSLKSKLIKQN